tara:strand:+ start:162 stop:473 length:312 start_codon:yes stop_codon:yes gene_type:complete
MSIFILIVLAQVIAILAVRDRSEIRLKKMRAELMAMRSDAQHLQSEKEEVRKLISWVSESLKRCAKRQETAQSACLELRDILTAAGIDVKPIEIETPDEEINV